jgi:parallel beta-helix repeat protein
LVKKVVSEIVLALLLINVLALAFNIQTVKAESSTIIVPDDYLTIQGAINHANEGDTIYVKAGIYYENVVVNKSLILMGEGKETRIDGYRREVVVWVRAENVTIEGFTIRNGGDNYSGILLSSSENNVVDNLIIDNWCGIESENTTYNVIANNTITNNVNGIAGQLWSNNTIIGNSITDNLLGIWIGYNSMRNIIAFNDIRNHWDAGISMSESYQNLIIGNSILFNNHGNYSAGIAILNSEYNRILHNNMVNKGKQVKLLGNEINIWDDGYPSGGNYWSDYNGSDLHNGPYQNLAGSDGIGDTPYVINAENEDEYPLINPYPLPDMRLTYDEFYDLLPTFVYLQSKYDDLLSSYDDLVTSYSSLQAELDYLQSKNNDLQSEYNSLANELYLTRNVMYALLITTMVFIAASVYVATRKPNIKFAEHHVAAIINSELEKISLRFMAILYVFLTIVDIAQTFWGFPDYEVGIIAKVFITFFGDWAWLYFPLRIIVTSIIVFLSYNYVTPHVSKKLFVVLSLITLAAVILNIYFLIMLTNA